ncbi:hypothetical protein JHK87_009296 [Glycine soja]|nr:hypothetical protein JHK87_009296 [Glycine soja]
MASRYRSVSQPAFSIIKSTITKPSSKLLPSSFLLKTRSPVTARQVPFVPFRGGWAVSSVACSRCFPCTRRFHQRASPHVWASIRVGRGRCLRIIVLLREWPVNYVIHSHCEQMIMGGE